MITPRNPNTVLTQRVFYIRESIFPPPTPLENTNQFLSFFFFFFYHFCPKSPLTLCRVHEVFDFTALISHSELLIIHTQDMRSMQPLKEDERILWAGARPLCTATNCCWVLSLPTVVPSSPSHPPFSYPGF